LTQQLFGHLPRCFSASKYRPDGVLAKDGKNNFAALIVFTARYRLYEWRLKMNTAMQTRVVDDTLVIRDSASFQTWRRQLRAITLTGDMPAVSFQLPELSYEKNQSVSALASSYQKECGCASGGFFMSLTVVAIVVSYFVSGNHLSNINLRGVLSFLGAAVLAAVVGKLLGLLWARWRLLRLAADIQVDVARAIRE
jgi:hypothetical protein